MLLDRVIEDVTIHNGMGPLSRALDLYHSTGVRLWQGSTFPSCQQGGCHYGRVGIHTVLCSNK